MKKPFILFILMLICCSLHADDIHKHYVQAVHPEGYLYHIFKHEIPSVNPKGEKSLVCDYTYLDSKDSVTIHITTEMESPIIFDSVIFVSGNDTLVSDMPTMLYCEPHKNKWINRIECFATFDNLMNMFGMDTPFKIILSSSETAKELAYSYPSKKWNKTRGVFFKIFRTIKINQKKNLSVLSHNINRPKSLNYEIFNFHTAFFDSLVWYSARCRLSDHLFATNAICR